MARRRHRSLADRYRPQAQQEAALRANPQKRALQQALDEALGARDSTVTAARGTARGLRQSIRAARPSIREIFDTAGQQLAAGTGAVAPNMSSPQGSAIGQAAATEHQAALDRNTAARASTLTDLDQQRVRATEGEAFAVRQAGTQYQSDASKVLKQLLGVSADQGDYAATELSRLVEAARGRGVTLRGQDLSHQDRVASRKSQERTAAAKNKQTTQGKKWLPLGDQNDAQDTIHQALDFAKDFVPHASRKEAATALRQGVKDQKVKNLPINDPATGKQRIDQKSGLKLYRDPDTGKSTTQPEQSIPGVPSFDDAYVQAALDVAYDGHLSRATQNMLHRRGIKVRQLGLPTYQQWRARNRSNPTERAIRNGELAGPPAPH